MLQGTQSRRKKRIGGGRKALSTFRNVAVDPLARPKVSKSIPTEYRTDSSSPRWAQIALLWLDAGVLTEADEGDAKTLVRTALLRWVAGMIEGNTVLRQFNLLAHTYPDEHGGVPEEIHRTDELDTTKWMFGIIGGVEFPWFTLEEKLTALEKEHPGLGETAWNIFESFAYRIFPFITPQIVRDWACRVWWYWMDNDKDLKEELEANEESIEDFEAPTPSIFDASYPKWVLNASMALSNDQLQVIGDNSTQAEVKDLVSRLLALSQLGETSFRMPTTFEGGPIDSQSIYSMAYFRWNEKDFAMQVIDDVDEEINNYGGDGYTELFGADAVPLDPTEFLTWKSEVEQGFVVLKHLDGLLPLIATPIESE